MTIYSVSSGQVVSGITLGGFDELNVLAGGSAVSTTIRASADLYVRSGGFASGTVISSGGGGFITGTSFNDTVHAGGFEYVEGGDVGSAHIDGGAIQYVEDGGIALDTVLRPGAAQELADGGAAGTVVSSGAVQIVSSGSTVADTSVAGGGAQEVLPGATVTSTTVANDGTMVVMPGAEVTGTTLDAGALLVSTGIVYNPYPPAVVIEPDTLSGFTVGATAALYVLPDGVTRDTEVGSGGAEVVVSGGVASMTTVAAGGVQTVNAGSAYGTVVSGGGSGAFGLQEVISGGVASAATVFGGGAQNLSGGSAFGTVLSGGAEFVESHGVADGTTIAAGGYQYVSAGGVVSATSVLAGGGENVSGGVAYMTQEAAGGRIAAALAGTLVAPSLAGVAVLGPGGIASGAEVFGGGTLALAGGTARATTVQSGGLAVLSGNANYPSAVSEAFGTTISAGGAEVVEALGEETDPTIAGGGLVLAGGLVSGGIDFAGTGGKLVLDETPPDNLITGFGPGDAIGLATVNYSSAASFSVTGPDQVVISAGGLTYTLDIAGAAVSAPYLRLSESTDGSILLTETAPCFAAGTHILTPRGEMAVERLGVGDLVITAAGVDAPVVWLGRRRLDLARHVRPESVRPVRIAADSFAEGVPSRDLYVSPDHALFVDGVLIPAKALLNGRNVVQVSQPAVTYYHVELAAHGVIFADGMAAESYLETGNRGAFENGETAVILHPDFAQTMREARSCAPFTETGPVVEAVTQRLLERHYAAVAAPRQARPRLLRHR